MKMHAIVVKQGFAVIAAFCSNMCLFRNPVITILKFIGCENCVRENKLALFLQLFLEKNSHFNVILMAFLRIFRAIRKSKSTKIWKNLKKCLLLSPISPRALTGQVQNTFKC